MTTMSSMSPLLEPLFKDGDFFAGPFSPSMLVTAAGWRGPRSPCPECCGAAACWDRCLWESGRFLTGCQARGWTLWRARRDATTNLTYVAGSTVPASTHRLITHGFMQLDSVSARGVGPVPRTLAMGLEVRCDQEHRRGFQHQKAKPNSLDGQSSCSQPRAWCLICQAQAAA